MATEKTVCYAIAEGVLPSPTRFWGSLYVAVRVSGTGVAYRASLGEMCYRDPDVWLSDEMKSRWLGAPLILMHPSGSVLTSEEFADRVIGMICHTYVRGDELWSICRVVDDTVGRALEAGGAITDSSPAVLFNPDKGPGAYIDVEGQRLLVEDVPVLCDHLAVLPEGMPGVWSKGGSVPSGIDSSVQVES
jgi:colicin import membrane protein